VVARASAGVATGVPLCTGPIPSMVAVSPLNSAVSTVPSPTKTVLDAEVKLSMTGGDARETSVPEEPQAAPRSEQTSTAAIRLRDGARLVSITANARPLARSRAASSDCSPLRMRARN